MKKLISFGVPMRCILEGAILKENITLLRRAQFFRREKNGKPDDR